jgi:hypothetical protein
VRGGREKEKEGEGEGEGGGGRRRGGREWEGDSYFLFPHLRTSYLKQRCTVEHEQRLEYFIQLVQSIHILQVLADVKQVQKPANVPFFLDKQRQLLPALEERCCAHEQGQDVFQLAQFTGWEFWDAPAVVKPVRQVFFREVPLYLDNEWSQSQLRKNKMVYKCADSASLPPMLRI